ncbi:MAG: DUF5717 family protein, partial [Lachnospiraceae bacterium]
EYEIEKPVITPESIEERTTVNNDYKGQIIVKAGGGSGIKILCSVSNARIVLLNKKFTGRNVIIPFGVDVRGLKEHDFVKGKIVLSSNFGEYVIPVTVEVCEELSSSGNIPVASVADFGFLAKNDYAEAFRVFSEGGLSGILKDDPARYTLYRGLLSGTATYQKMEEFLTACGQKENLEYSLDTDFAVHRNATEPIKDYIVLRKNTWGNVNLYLKAHGDFISLVKNRYREEDFIGNVLDIPYMILCDKLGSSVRKGYIEIISDNGCLRFDVTASGLVLDAGKDYLRYKKSIGSIMRALMDFRLGKIDAKAMLIKSIPSFNYLKERVNDIRLLLMEAYFYLLGGNYEYASDLLEELNNVDFDEESAECEAGFLYLSCAANLIDMSNEQLADVLRDLYIEERNSEAIVLMLCDVDDSLRKRPAKILKILEKLFSEGNRSPMLWLQASAIFNKKPELFEALTEFNKFVISNMIRYSVAKNDLILRAALLSENEKRFSMLVYGILKKAYALMPSDEIVELICKLIIKGNPKKKEYFSWYENAVNRNIEITKIYEYYIESCSFTGNPVLHPRVYRYFMLNNSLSLSCRSKLYANIIINKNRIKSIFEEYYDIINGFAYDCLEKNLITENLALIYSEFIPEVRTLKMAEMICNVMFRHVLICDRMDFREVIVRHPQLREEVSYPVSCGKAYIDIYNRDAVIIFADAAGKRYVNNVNYTVNSLFDYSGYADKCSYMGLEDPYLYLYFSSEIDAAGVEVNDDNIRYFRYIVNSHLYTSGYRQKNSLKVLDYYSKETDYRIVSEFIENCDINRMARANHLLLSEIMISNGKYEDAFDILCKYGYEDISTSVLLKLVSKMIGERELEFDEELFLMAAHVFFAGGKNKNILKYLCLYFEGEVSDMEQIRMAASDEGLYTHSMDEKILLYSIFTRTHPENAPGILEDYLSDEGDTDLCEAYAAFEALYDFMEDINMNDTFMNVIRRKKYYVKHDIILLAFLKSLASKEHLDEEERAEAAVLLDMSIKRGYVFGFYRNLPIEMLERYQLDDKMILELKGMESDSAVLHYKNSANGDDRYREIPMKHMYRGVMSAPVVMFSGDILRYYFTIFRDGESFDTEVEVKAMNMTDYNGKSCYRRINKMIYEVKQGNITAFYETLKKYRLASHVTGNLFELKKTIDSEE